MSLKTSNKVDTNRYELEILIDGESFRNAILTVYKKEKKNIAVQGFRKGKAPLSIIEKYYGEGVFFEDALNLLYGEAIDAAAKEAGLTVIDDEMKFDLVSISKQDGVDFKVTLTTKPEVEVSEYKGIAAEKLICEVTEARVISDRETMTYTYYHENVKPKPETDGKKGYVCTVCGWVYEGDTLPDDIVCPLCKHGASDFEKIK